MPPWPHAHKRGCIAKRWPAQGAIGNVGKDNRGPSRFWKAGRPDLAVGAGDSAWIA